MRFEQSVYRYDEDDVIRRILAIMGLPSPPPEKARTCAETLLDGDLMEKLLAMLPDAGVMQAQHRRILRERVASLLAMLDAPKIEPTAEQIQCDKQLGQSLHVACPKTRTSVDIHAGIGAIYYRSDAATGTFISQVAPITGPGMDRRRDYLISVVEMTRNTVEQTFS